MRLRCTMETAFSWYIPLGKLTVRELVLFAILGAMTFAAKYVMSFLPNIEPVSLCVMLFAAVFGKKWVYPVYLYVLMEILFYGISLWNINYLYIWAVLAIAAYCLRGMQSSLGWALLSGGFGLLFGALCGIVDIFIGGFSYALTRGVSGIPFDIAHCAGNFVMALLLFSPIRKRMEMLYQRKI